MRYNQPESNIRTPELAPAPERCKPLTDTIMDTSTLQSLTRERLTVIYWSIRSNEMDLDDFISFFD